MFQFDVICVKLINFFFCFFLLGKKEKKKKKKRGADGVIPSFFILACVCFSAKSVKKVFLLSLSLSLSLREMRLTESKCIINQDARKEHYDNVLFFH